MNKNLKKALSVLLAIILLSGTAPIGLFNPVSKASAKTIQDCSVGDIITFGSYPQREVTDSETLNGIKSVENNYQWTSYNYYSGSGRTNGTMKPDEDMMYYKDIQYHNCKYRAVWIKKYRPFCAGGDSSTDTFQDDNGYFIGKVYYFKYEPLTWRVLDPIEGFVMCNKVIDSQAFNNYVIKNNYIWYGNSAQTYYASNWENSSLRLWLNNDFYNTSFSSFEKSKIATTYNNNKENHSSANTYDRIYILSEKNVINTSYGFSSNYYEDSARIIKSTDYAKCQGCYEYEIEDGISVSNWFLRSTSESDCLWGIGECGSTGVGCYVDDTSTGVVPAFKFLTSSVIIDYIISYDANGGINAPITQNSDNSYTISATIPKRTGYNFMGWSTSIGATFPSFQPGENIILSSDITFYAVWGQTDLSLSSTLNTQIIYAGQIYYYKFTPLVSGNYIIYSEGTSDTYVYLYDSSGERLAYNDDSGESTNFKLMYNLVAGRTYYYGVKYYSSSKIGTITTYFSSDFVTIKYNTNGGVLSSDFLTAEKGENINLPTPTKNGCDFIGWSTDPNETNPVYKAGETITVNGDMTFYAIWSDITSPTGSISCDNRISTVQTVTLSFADNVGVAGYYWGPGHIYNNNPYTETYSSTVTKYISTPGRYYLTVKDTSGNVSESYSVTFYRTTLNANGGSVSPSIVITKSGNSFALPNPIRKGCIFKGWATDRDTMAVVYAPGASITANQNSSLYAVWEDSGQCGNYVYWSVDESTGTIKISGTGEMYNYINYSPFCNADSFEDVVIENGVTNIGDFTFANCCDLQNVEISDSVTSIGTKAFYGTKIRRMTINENIQSVGDDAFNNCTSLSEVAIFNPDLILGSNAFKNCNENLCIYSYKDGNVEKYCNDNGIQFKELEITNIEVTQNPYKTHYYAGEKIDTDGLKLKVTYNNFSEHDIESGFVCTQKILTQIGYQNIEIDYAGVKCNYRVNVSNIFPTKLSVDKIPKKTVYYKGDSLDVNGLELSVTYNNGDVVKLTDLSQVDFTYSFSFAGSKKVTIDYEENGVALNTNYYITVLEKSELYSENISCYSGDTVAVPVYLNKNNGIMGFKVSLAYDPIVLTPASVVEGEILGVNPDGTQIISILNSNVDNNPNGKLDVIWSSTENMTSNGTLFWVYFQVDGKAEGDYSISIDYDPESTFDENENSVKFDCTGSVVSVEYLEPSEPIIKIDSISAKSGETISIPVKAVNIPATEDFEVNVLFDKNIYSSIEIDSPLTDDIRIRNSGVRVTFEDIPAITNSTLFTIKLTIADSAEGEYLFELDADDVQLENGTVNITPNITTIYADDVAIESIGQIISVPVYIKDNHGMMGYGIDISYDTEYLSLVSIANGTAFNQGLFDYNVFSEESYAHVVWSYSDNINSNGLLFTLNFRVEKLPKQNTIVGISYDQDDTFNSDWEDVVLECKDIVIKNNNFGIIFAKDNSSTVVEENYIYGLNAGLKSLDDYVGVLDGYDIRYAFDKIIGTGSIVEAVKEEVVVESRTVIIFGDVNGDGWYDGTDAMIVKLIANGMLTKDSVTEAQYMAADCNHDGVIDNLDVELLEQAGILLANVDQSKSSEELLATSSAYVEYLNLIDQNVNVDENTTENQIEEPYEPSPMPVYQLNSFEKIIAFFMAIWKYFFSFMQF